MAVQISGNDITVPRDGSFTRNVTIGGTLTYEDVTNIDSVGLVTARTGIEVGARPGVAASISVDGNAEFAGIVTAAQFKLPDNAKALYGDSGDLQIYHSTNSLIQNGTGTLQIVTTTGGLFLRGQDNITFNIGGNNEKLRIDSEGRLLSRHSASRTVGTKTGQIQVIESGNNAAISIIQTNNAASAPFLAFGKTRSANDTDSTIVQNGDSLGQILFAGADGTDVDSTGALITAKVDGTPGSNDMPGKLVFATTADGASTATSRMEISSAGIVTCRSIPSFKCAIESDASPNSGVVSEDNGYTLHSAIGGYRDSFNTGSHFNEANGRFTAPVEGLYFFGFSVMRSSSSGSGSIDLRIKKNASLMLARTYRVGYSSNFESHNVQTITRMLAGHYITFNLGANMSVYEDDSYMFGYLIG